MHEDPNFPIPKKKIQFEYLSQSRMQDTLPGKMEISNYSSKNQFNSYSHKEFWLSHSLKSIQLQKQGKDATIVFSNEDECMRGNGESRLWKGIGMVTAEWMWSHAI